MADKDSTKTEKKSRTTQFTDRVVADLPTDTAYDASDSLCKGLFLRLQKSGLKTWWLWLYTPDRTQRYKWRIGNADAFKCYENTPASASNRERSIRDVANSIKAQSLTVDLRAAKAARAAKVDSERLAKLGDFIDLHYKGFYIAKGLAQPDAMIGWFKKSFGDMLDMRMDRITHLTIRGWILKQQKTKANGTVARLQAALGAILSEAVAQDLIPHHPLQKKQRDNSTTKLELVKPDEGKIRWLSAEEETRLRTALMERDQKLKSARARYITHRKDRHLPAPKAITGAYADHLTPLVLIAMNTGIRRGALLGMKWEDISAGEIHVVKGLDKAGKGYHVDINSEVADVLRLWERQTSDKGLVFKHHGKPIKSVKTAWLNLMKTAQIEDFRFHDLRHHFATRLAEVGTAPITIMKLMGHSSIDMTTKYMHATDQMKKSAVESIRR